MRKSGFVLTVVLLTAVFLFSAVGCTEDSGTLPPDDEIPTYLPNTDESYWTYTYQRYQYNVPLDDPFSVTYTFDGSSVVGSEAVQNFVRTVESVLPYEVFLVQDNEMNTYQMYGREYYDGTRGLTDSIYFDPTWVWFQYPLSVGMNWQVTNIEGISPLAIGFTADIDKDGFDDTVDVEINCHVRSKEDVTTDFGVFTDSYKIERDLYIYYHLTQGEDSGLDFVQYFWFKPEKGTVKMSGDEIRKPADESFTFEATLNEYDIKPLPE